MYSSKFVAATFLFLLHLQRKYILAFFMGHESPDDEVD
jgi:hypothetical protein